jgi:N-acetylmuramoyl-L-alanine amidase
MAKKIYLSPSSQVENSYATGKTNEQEQCRKIATACSNYLKAKGFETICADYGTMYSRVTESNKVKADLHVAIHTNATANHKTTGGTQVLLYALNGERYKAGKAVFNRLSPLTPGNSAEKIAAKPGFYEIKNADAVTVYVEVEFHDTKEGANYIINNVTAIGEAIAKGICDYYGVSTVQTKEEKINADVKAWQTAAIADGYSFPKHGADGDWGAECEAVAEVAVCKKLVIGYKNKNLTKFVQKKVGLTGNNVDGKFGKTTKNAVKAYQKKNGLDADGVVGYKTWKKMCGVK